MKLTRRELLKTGATGLAAGAFFASSRDFLFGEDVPSVPKFEILDTKIISDQPNVYYGWPTVGVTASDELLVAVSGGRRDHVCPFGRVDLFRSKDGGQTWDWPQTIYDGPSDDRDAGLLVTAKGTLLVTTFTSLAYRDVIKREVNKREKGEGGRWLSDADLALWQRMDGRISQEEKEKELGCWMLRSTDGGINWSARYRVAVNSPHGPFSLSDGRILYAGGELWTPNERRAVWESKDDGENWDFVSEIPARSGDNPQNYHELHGVETASGKILVQIRNHNSVNNNETLQTESTDGGKTWSEPHSIGVWGLPSHLRRLADGRILMTYGYRRPPFGNHARLSEDEGKTWSEPIPVSADGTGGDLGYPSSVQMADGSIVSVWYERMESRPLAVLRMAKWRLG